MSNCYYSPGSGCTSNSAAPCFGSILDYPDNEGANPIYSPCVTSAVPNIFLSCLKGPHPFAQPVRPAHIPTTECSERYYSYQKLGHLFQTDVLKGEESLCCRTVNRGNLASSSQFCVQ